MDDIALTDNPGAHRFELRRGGALAAHADYTLRGGVLTLVHTEVGKAFEGQGLGSRIARFALDDIRRRGLKVVPVCEFFAGWMGKHPEYDDLRAGG
jgi:predicted GNAT family acetyltransferase